MCLLYDTTFTIYSNPDIKALITTGEGKYYSTGLDLSIFNDADTSIKEVFQEFNRIINRLVTFPMLTMAAINGEML